MTENIENNSTGFSKGNNLAESLRCHYLNVMGIQTWFDPELEGAMPELPVENVPDLKTEQDHNNKLSGSPQLTPEKLITETPQTETFTQVQATTSQQTQRISVDNLDNLDDLNLKIFQCELCELHTSRKQVITGEGNTDANLFIITDAPVDDSNAEYALLNINDKAMLQQMLQTINCSLSSVFISSLVKCRPPEQRLPQTSEMICCDDHLTAQIKLVKPDVILVMGELASQQLLVSQKSLTDLRLRQHKHLGIPVYASYHPAEMFDSSETKRKVWADLLQISNHI
ncbi:MAG: uracil-DNA glycosylase [Gammaproteobacteria bacterium]|nr:uracil-DNA glycosylase [Gammaproteobacteria bacterium]